MADSADIIRSEAISILQKIHGNKVHGETIIRARQGHNPVVLACIAYYKQNNPIKTRFEEQFTEKDLLWFYNNFKYDGNIENKPEITELTPSQRRELIMTIYRYWNLA